MRLEALLAFKDRGASAAQDAHWRVPGRRPGQELAPGKLVHVCLCLRSLHFGYFELSSSAPFLVYLFQRASRELIIDSNRKLVDIYTVATCLSARIYYGDVRGAHIYCGDVGIARIYCNDVFDGRIYSVPVLVFTVALLFFVEPSLRNKSGAALTQFPMRPYHGVHVCCLALRRWVWHWPIYIGDERDSDTPASRMSCPGHYKEKQKLTGTALAR
ncbi:hypothetical protein NDU88_001741 [Pleurodeles waltl]|uniref:Uncharacterized protein n=1 Tax=Pleurodeles waltl TaxID=8319 RepID=A0AAV7TJ39_PLEWA|nr:hypothetical protein NDU88_001741 [Pleurodeles waltl]